MGAVRTRVARGLVATLLAATAAVAAVPTPASAAVPGLVYVRAITSFDSNVYKSVRLFCPPGTVVIGGSFDLQGAEGAIVLDDFIPSPTDLLVGAGEIVGPGEPSDGTPASWQVVALAVCASPPPGYSIVTQTSDFSRAADRTVGALCPPGTRRLGAGASLSNGWGQVSISELWMNNGANGQTAVVARSDADGYSGSWSVTAYAICADPLPGWIVTVANSATDSQSHKSEATGCLSGQAVIGAAWRVNDSNHDGVDWYVTGAVLSAAPDPSVTTTAFATGIGDAWTLSSRAVCVDQ